MMVPSIAGMAEVRIRTATLDDAPALAAFRWSHDESQHESQHASQIDQADFVAWMRDHRASHTAFVAERDDGFVGVAWLAIQPRPPGPAARSRAGGDIQSVYVVPELRNRGIGTALVAAIIEAADGRRLEHLVVRSGRRALPFYRRMGFESNERNLELRRG